MSAYYNEFKPEAAHMLRQLIKDGLIAPGDVDERSITEVKADDLRGYTQCHFFAGIGGWSVALRAAMWGDDRPVWTGSCPCQPFSTAGEQKGHSDERHLWPHWARLIGESKPPVIFGEQVASAIAYGWWDDVATDLEAQEYACAAAVLPACSVGKPHKRDRLWFVGNTEHNGCDGAAKLRGDEKAGTEWRKKGPDFAREPARASGPGDVCGLFGCLSRKRQDPAINEAAGDGAQQWEQLPDGKSRLVKPGIRLLADGVQHRAPIIHAFGNAIVPQVAAQFIKATM